jgi:hypothetical protein
MALHFKPALIKSGLIKSGPIALALLLSWTLTLTCPAQDSGQTGNIIGTVVDQSGAVVPNADVQLEVQLMETLQSSNPPASHQPSSNPPASNQPASNQKVRSGSDGKFSFTNVPPGPYHLTISSAGFSSQTISGTLNSGQSDTVPPITLAVAARITEVNVSLTREEIAEVAEVELKIEEKQRVLGAIPNFYVTYNPNAAPLNAKQKFKLAARSVIDPFTFVVVGGTAGVEQAQNHFRQYGQGTEGYAKRFGAGYADTVSGTFIGGAILPALLKQDPRYFYKGTGGFRARALYAIANSVICKGDNRRWQPNYSNILGSIAAGGISNIYYPPQDRDGATLTFENAAINVGSTAIENLLQEFLIRHLTPKLPKPDTATPAGVPTVTLGITHN